MNIKRKKTKISLVCLASLYLLLLSILSCIESPTKPEVYEPGIITMKTIGTEEVKFGILGIGKAVINWESESVEGRYEIILNNNINYFIPTYYINLGSRNLECIITIEGYVTNLYTDSNGLNELNVSDMPSLSVLSCDYNQLSELDVSKNKSLETLFCYQNFIENINLTGCDALVRLSAGRNQIKNLDLSKNKFLSSLGVENNLLQKIDLKSNIYLKALVCCNNLLKDLDLNENTSLTELHAFDNQLDYLDLTNNTLLAFLNVKNNKIKKSDIDEDDNSLSTVIIFDNYLEAESLNDIFSSLNKVTNDTRNFYNGDIVIWDNPGESECDRSIAEEKGWNIRESFHTVIEDKIGNMIKNYKNIWRNHEKNYN
jgi:hypothetical protein